MSSTLKKSSPFLVILLGLLFLFILNQPILAGACFLIVYVILIECIWPEEWDAERKK